METNPEVVLCSINRCPNRAMTSVSGQVGQWIIVISYCEEHGNESAHSTPLGGVGLDSSRLQVAPVDETMPQTGGRFPGSA
jgi:hypothetical protein